MSFDARKKVYIGQDNKEHFYEEDRRGLDEWAYDEISIVDEVYLSHEIELHSGTIINLHFKSLAYKRIEKRSWQE